MNKNKVARFLAHPVETCHPSAGILCDRSLGL